ncbi:MAG: VOC family protein [Deltaproteobacteria bacterium]|nr:VOC family protein [Deltaproteobacteria bacterium]
MRLRQVALVGEKLAEVTDDLCDVLGIEVAYHDPGVKVFGLENAVMPIGDGFLEVVSPVTEETPARRYRSRRGGDSGYMVMVQTGRFDADRKRLAAEAVRLVWEGELPDIRGMHLHPKDTGGTLLSLDEPVPAEAWRWAGPAWREHVKTDRVTGLRGATIGCADPEAVASRWSQLLERAATCGAEPRIDLDASFVRFVAAADARDEGLVGFTVAALDPEAILEAARARGLATGADFLVACGTRIELES